MVRIVAVSFIFASGQDVFLQKPLVGTCSDLCHDGGHGTSGFISGTAPFCGGECADCGDGHCYHVESGSVSDYGNGCTTGNKVCCCSKNFHNMNESATEDDIVNSLVVSDASEKELASSVATKLFSEDSAAAMGWTAVSGNGWCVDKSGNEGVNRAFGKGNDCMNRCKADRTCPGFASGGQNQECVWYTDVSPTTTGRPASSFAIDHAAWSASQPWWSTAKCFKYTSLAHTGDHPITDHNASLAEAAPVKEFKVGSGTCYGPNSKVYNDGACVNLGGVSGSAQSLASTCHSTKGCNAYNFNVNENRGVLRACPTGAKGHPSSSIGAAWVSYYCNW